jgi:hypothetical protein
MLENVNEHGKIWSKLSVTKELQTTVNRIAADQNRFVYDLAEEIFKELYPNYLQK